MSTTDDLKIVAISFLVMFAAATILIVHCTKPIFKHHAIKIENKIAEFVTPYMVE